MLPTLLEGLWRCCGFNVAATQHLLLNNTYMVWKHNPKCISWFHPKMQLPLEQRISIVESFETHKTRYKDILWFVNIYIISCECSAYHSLPHFFQFLLISSFNKELSSIYKNTNKTIKYWNFNSNIIIGHIKKSPTINLTSDKH